MVAEGARFPCADYPQAVQKMIGGKLIRWINGFRGREVAGGSDVENSEGKPVGFWPKTWAFIKKYSHIIMLALGAVVGFILGRRPDGRVVADFERLRADNQQLVDQIHRLREELESSIERHKSDGRQIVDLRNQLDDAERILQDARAGVESGVGDIDRLRETNRRLGEWIQKYGTQVELVDDDK
jgi:hypothetical protein